MSIARIENTFLRRLAIVAAVIVLTPVALVAWICEGIINGASDFWGAIKGAW